MTRRTRVSRASSRARSLSDLARWSWWPPLLKQGYRSLVAGTASRACARLTLSGGHYRMRRPGMQDGNKSIQMRRLELSARGCVGGVDERVGGRAGGRMRGSGGREAGARWLYRPTCTKRGRADSSPFGICSAYAQRLFSASRLLFILSRRWGIGRSCGGIGGAGVGLRPTRDGDGDGGARHGRASKTLAYDYAGIDAAAVLVFARHREAASSSAPRALFSPSPTTLGMLTVPGRWKRCR